MCPTWRWPIITSCRAAASPPAAPTSTPRSAASRSTRSILLYAHVGGMDTCARALLAAATMVEDGKLAKIVADRYAGWNGAEAKAILKGKRSLEDLAGVRRAQAPQSAAGLGPTGISGESGQPVRLRHQGRPSFPSRGGRRMQPARGRVAIHFGRASCNPNTDMVSNPRAMGTASSATPIAVIFQ